MSSTPDQPLDFAGRYVVERELGHGASAIVYLARDTVYDRLVAVKVLREEFVESLGAERFLREIRRTARLQHPHVLSVLDDGETEDGRLFFVTPYMDGGTLRDRLTREKQLPLRDAVAVAHAVAMALDHAHARGLLHRDVKPENILFSGADDVYLGDFGIARALEPGADGGTTTTGLVRGTPAYMSPEQASGEQELDGRSDQYALAIVLYEMLAGVRPFSGATPQAVIAQRFVHAPPPVTQYRDSVPAELAAVLKRALSITPADRWPTMRAFAEALAATGLRHSQDQVVPPPEPQPSWWQRLARAVRPHAGQASALVVVTTMAVSVALYRERLGDGPTNAAGLDTTQVFVVPAEVTRSAGDAPVALFTELLTDALNRWDSVSVVDEFGKRDALKGASPTRLTDEEALAAARRSGAGRLVRAQAIADQDSVRVHAVLYDVETGQRLHSHVLNAPPSGAGVRRTLEQLADTLLLRGARAIPTSAGTAATAGTSSLPAAQAMARALRALDDWDLPTVDSTLAEALRYDPQFTRAVYWQAQVRAWRDERAERWAGLAERAAADSSHIAAAERPAAVALAALGRADYRAACATYDAIRRANPREFVGWYGVAQCNDMDRVVEPDPGSPSGWRFRRGYREAIASYTRALELFPRVHRVFQGNAYQLLRRKLLTSATDARLGVSIASEGGASDTLRFIARPALIHDTLALVPFPLRDAPTRATETLLATTNAAVARNRAVFHQIVASWAAALPQSAGVKEALAISLEMRGDASAADTLNAARLLATDPSHRLRLAAAETFTRLRFGLPGNLGEVRAAVAVADTLLRLRPASPTDARALLSLAALTGKCALAVKLARQAASRWDTPVQVPSDLVGAAHGLTVALALGCPGIDVPHAIDSLARIAVRLPRPSEAVSANYPAYLLLNRALGLAAAPETTWTKRFSREFHDFWLATLLAAYGADTRSALRSIEAVWKDNASRGRPTAGFDTAVPEARVWLRLGSVARARATAGATLETVRTVQPGWFEDPILVAGLMRTIELHVRLSSVDGRHDAGSRAWKAALDALWANADQGLRDR